MRSRTTWLDRSNYLDFSTQFQWANECAAPAALVRWARWHVDIQTYHLCTVHYRRSLSLPWYEVRTKQIWRRWMKFQSIGMNSPLKCWWTLAGGDQQLTLFRILWRTRRRMKVSSRYFSKCWRGLLPILIDWKLTNRKRPSYHVRHMRWSPGNIAICNLSWLEHVHVVLSYLPFSLQCISMSISHAHRLSLDCIQTL